MTLEDGNAAAAVELLPYQEMTSTAADPPVMQSLQRVEPKPYAVLLQSAKQLPAVKSVDAQEPAHDQSKHAMLTAPTIPPPCPQKSSQDKSQFIVTCEDSRAPGGLIKAVRPAELDADDYDVRKQPSSRCKSVSVSVSSNSSYACIDVNCFITKLPDLRATSLSSLNLEVRQLGTNRAPLVVGGAFKHVERVSLSAQNIYLELPDGVEWMHCDIDAKYMLLVRITNAAAFVKAVRTLNVRSAMVMGVGMLQIVEALDGSGKDYRVRKADGRGLLTAGGCYYPWEERK